jgi:hypothetical protein
MTAVEFRGWLEFYSAEPFGEVRADTRAAVVASTFARVMAGKKGTTAKLIDFMPYVKAQREADERDNPDVRRRNMMLAFEHHLGATKVRRVTVPRPGA